MAQGQSVRVSAQVPQLDAGRCHPDGGHLTHAHHPASLVRNFAVV